MAMVGRCGCIELGGKTYIYRDSIPHLRWYAAGTVQEINNARIIFIRGNSVTLAGKDEYGYLRLAHVSIDDMIEEETEYERKIG